ncbi:dynein heavy chain and region D6 of dynein motor-domain-containing protein [Polychytrium aggregatum]|uniref:dynein heavy chain and region D6 of dynein motor-domain-containing protein n=1 Tax=Polychytrium aggregatum TaxID=110093 RepID=UPI0022FF3A2D|nr:dynein heavy chain and region D6 of dynein motor-domain-containing protein [Polychytrium aggregatum]KAI9204192.1 dynein heavy chain and region D6 of dynein motor-domain-containing protein [Polychytrium aggregatum]
MNQIILKLEQHLKKRSKKAMREGLSEALHRNDPYRSPMNLQSAKYLPLEWFDDIEMDPYTPQEWVGLGGDDGGTPAVSRFFFYPESDVDWQWLSCRVIGYDDTLGLFSIKWENSDQVKLAKRLNICFRAERMDKFYSRIETAFRLRNAAHQQVCYLRNIEEMKSKYRHKMPKRLKIRLLDAVKDHVSMRNLATLEHCVLEIETDYTLSMRRAEYDHVNGPYEATLQQIATATSEKFAKLALEKSGANQDDIQDKLYKSVALSTREMSTYMFLANAEVQRTIIDILGSLRNVFSDSDRYFQKRFELPLSFYAFCDKLKSHVSCVQVKLTHEWPHAIASRIKSQLGEYFNLKESRDVAHQTSRCKDFLRMVNLVMKQQASACAYDGLKLFLKMFNVIVRDDLYAGPERRSSTHGDIQSTSLFNICYDIQVPTAVPEAPLPLPCVVIIKISVRDISGIYYCTSDVPTERDNAIGLDPPLELLESAILELFTLPRISTSNSIPTIESLVLPFLEVLEPNTITLDYDEPLILDGSRILLSLIRETYTNINSLVNQYTAYEFLVQEELSDETFQNAIRHIDLLRELLSKYHEATTTVGHVSLDYVRYPPLVVDCAEIKKTLGMAKSMEEGNRYHKKLKYLKQVWDLLEEYSVSFSDEINTQFWETWAWPKRLFSEVEEANHRLEESKRHIGQQIEVDTEFINSSVAAYTLEIDQHLRENAVDSIEIMYARVQSLRHKIDKIGALVLSVQERGKLIGLNQDMSFKAFAELIEGFKAYEYLWSLAGDIRTLLDKWMDSLFMDLDSKLISERFSTWLQGTQTLQSLFSNDPRSTQTIAGLEQSVKDFRRYMDVIMSLRNPALKPSHWEAIEKVVGISLEDLQTVTLRAVIKLDIELISDILSDVSKNASVEHMLEKSFDMIMAEFSTIELTAAMTADEKFTVVGSSQVTLSICDDHLIRLEQIFKRTLIQQLRTRVESWAKKVLRTQETIAAWAQFQHEYQRLQAALAAGGIQDALRRANVDNFLGVTKTMQLLSDFASKNKKLLAVLLRTELLDMINGALTRCESVLANVREILDIKRKSCPRFYFLSDLELMEVLRCNSPEHIGSHITSVFSNVAAVVFKSADQKETGGLDPAEERKSVLSHWTETTYMSKSTNDTSSEAGDDKRATVLGVESHEGLLLGFQFEVPRSIALEDFICILEREIQSRIWTSIKELLGENEDEPLTRLYHLHPIQSILAVLMVRWTRNISSVITKSIESGLSNYRKKLQKDLEVLVQATRTRKPMSSRVTLEILVTMVGYLIDSIDGVIAANVTSTTQYEWTSKLRYHVDHDETRLLVRMMGTQIYYGLEYVGGHPRIIMTPTAVRCFRNLVQMIGLSASPLLLGRSGVGKTELIMELASFVGLRCATLSYAPMLTECDILRHFYGMLATNCWMCVENLESYQCEQLSIFSQIAGSFQKSLQAAIKSKQTSIMFGDSAFPYNSTPCFFSTMTTTNLKNWTLVSPDVKALFRPIALTQPHTHVIVEGVLNARGFRMARQIGKKMAYFQSVSRIICGSRIEMELQLRRIKVILDAATGYYEETRTATNELKVIVRALHHYYLGQFDVPDRNVLLEIINDLFEDHKHNGETLLSEESWIAASKTVGNIVITDTFRHLLGEFHQTLESFNSVIILGRVCTGKTTLWKTYLEISNAQLIERERRLHISASHHFPNAAGNVDWSVFEASREVPAEGQSAGMTREVTQENECDNTGDTADIDEAHWIVWDGTISNMRDLNLMLVAENSRYPVNGHDEIMRHGNDTKIILETRSMEGVSPSIAGRYAILSVATGHVVDPACEMEARLAVLAPNFDIHKPLLMVFHKIIFMPLCDRAQQAKVGFWSANRVILTQQVMQLFVAMSKLVTDDGHERMTLTEQSVWCLASMIFCTVWTVGAFVRDEQRIEFDRALKAMIEGSELAKIEDELGVPRGQFREAIGLPAEHTAYDYYFDETLMLWKPWKQLHGGQYFSVIDAGCPEMAPTDELLKSVFFANALLDSGLRPIMLFKKRRRAFGSVVPLRLFVDDLEYIPDQALFEVLRMWCETGECDKFEPTLSEIVKLELRALRPQFATEELAEVIFVMSSMLLRWARDTLKPSPLTRGLIFSVADIHQIIRQLHRFLDISDDLNKIVAVWSYECRIRMADKLDPAGRQVFEDALGEISCQSNFAYTFEPTSIESVCAFSGCEMPTSELKQRVGCILHPDGVDQALRLAHKLKAHPVHVFLVGEEHDDRSNIIEFVAHLNGARFKCYEAIWDDQILDQSIQWRATIASLFEAVLETWKHIYFFIDSADIKEGYQWSDLISIMKLGYTQEYYAMSMTQKNIGSLKRHLQRHSSRRTSKDEEEELLPEFARLMRRYIHIIISFHDTRAGTSSSLLSAIGLLSTRHMIPSWSSATIACMTETAIQQSPHCSVIDTVRELVLEFFTSAYRQLTLKRIPSIKPVYVRTAIRLFVLFFCSKHELLNQQYAATTHAIEGIDRVVKLIDRVEEEYTFSQSEFVRVSEKTQLFLKRMENLREDLDRVKVQQRKMTDEEARLGTDYERLMATLAVEEAKVGPILSASVKSVEAIQKGELYEIKTMMNPPRAIQVIVETLCVIFKIEPRGSESLWESGKRFLSDARFIQSLTSFDKDSLTTPTVLKAEAYLSSADLTSKDLSKVSKSISSIVAWIHALTKYHYAMLSLLPSREAAATMKHRLVAIEEEMGGKTKSIGELESRLKIMKSEFDSVIREKDSAHRRYKDAENKRILASRIKDAIATSLERHEKQRERVKSMVDSLIANALLASHYIAYLGPMRPSDRRAIWSDWAQLLIDAGAVKSEAILSLSEFITDGKPADMFLTLGLPEDPAMLENYLVAKYHDRYPVLIDVENRMEEWIKALERERKPVVLNDPDSLSIREISLLISDNSAVIIKTLSRFCNQYVHLLTKHRCIPNLGRQRLRLLSNSVDIPSDFRIFIVLSAAQTASMVETWTQHTVPVQTELDHSSIQREIYQQLLQQEEPKLGEHIYLLRLDESNRRNKVQMMEKRNVDLVEKMCIDDVTGGELYRGVLENEEHTRLTLTTSGVRVAPEFNLVFRQKTEWLAKVSTWLCDLFQSIRKIEVLSPLYALSLGSFLRVVLPSIKGIGNGREPEWSEMKAKLALALHRRCASALSHGDRIVAAFLIMRWLAPTDDPHLQINDAEWQFMLNGAVQRQGHKEVPGLIQIPNPSPTWLAESKWKRILELSKMVPFARLPEEFVQHGNKATTPLTDQSWEDIFRALSPSLTKLPAKWEASLTKFQKLLIVQCIRPDALSECLEDYIRQTIGQEYLEDHWDPISEQFPHSGSGVPMVVVSDNLDLVPFVKRFAAKKKKAGACVFLSAAEKDIRSKSEQLLSDAMKRGQWLAVVYDGQTVVKQILETICKRVETATKPTVSTVGGHRTKWAVHSQFRLWVLTRPRLEIPSHCSHQGVIIHIDHMLGLKSRFFESFSAALDHLTPTEFAPSVMYRNFLFRMAAFHAVVQSRSRYLLSDLVVSYRFGAQDFQMAIRSLRELFSTLDPQIAERKIMGQAWNLFGDGSYGAAIIHIKDYHVISTLFLEHMMADWSNIEQGPIPQLATLKPVFEHMHKNELDACWRYIQDAAVRDSPGSFGLSDSMIRGYNECVSKTFLSSARSLNDDGIDQAQEPDFERIRSTAKLMIERIKSASEWMSEDSNLEVDLQTRQNRKYMMLLLAENIRAYAKLVRTIVQNLMELVEPSTEFLSSTLFAAILEGFQGNCVPIPWRRIAYRSQLPLSKWIDDLISRIDYMQRWSTVEKGSETLSVHNMIAYDISRLFQPKRLLMAIMNDHALNNNERLENMELESMILSGRQAKPPAVGCYITGLYLIGASWDFAQGVMRETKGGEQYTSVPCVWLQPVSKPNSIFGSERSVMQPRPFKKYPCPLYIYKPPTEEVDCLESTADALLMEFIDIPIEGAVKAWMKRNPCMVCEPPTRI